MKPQDQHSRYPTPRTYDELEADRLRRAEARRPRNVPMKVGVWMLLAFVVMTGALRFILDTFTTAMQQASGNVLSSISLVFFIALGAMAIIGYLYVSVDALLSRVLLSPVLFYILTMIITITVAGGIVLCRQAGMESWLVDGAWLVGYFGSIYYTTRFVIAREA